MKPIVGLPFAGAALLGTMLCALSLPLMARDHGRDHHRGWQGDIRHFDRHDARHWHSGGWRHAHHDGRLGWWWVVGSAWYFYPRPVHPYPDPYRPPVVIIEQAPAPVVVQVPPPAPTAPPVVVQAPVQYWYYCATAKGYYPYIPSCPSGWSKVPATPAGVMP